MEELESIELSECGPLPSMRVDFYLARRDDANQRALVPFLTLDYAVELAARYHGTVGRVSTGGFVAIIPLANLEEQS
jgi:hypothetical protein